MSNRKQKRATNAANRHARRGEGLAKASDVNKAIQQLNQNQANLGSIFQKNFEAVGHAFTLVDGHQHINRRILNDLIKGEVKMHEDPSEGIDYQWYVSLYNATNAVLFFLNWMARLGPKEVEQEPEPAEKLMAPPSEGDHVFGGDYAHQDSSPG